MENLEIKPNQELELSESLCSVEQIAIEHITQSPYQVRDFDREQHIDELADSIAAVGILQPLLLRSLSDSIPPYELVAGERRLRAAQSLGMKTVPAIIVDLDDRETIQASIVENLQRQDINPIEEAIAYSRLAKDFTLTQKEIAESVGKKRATISNSLRLLQLDPFVIQRLLDGSLSAGHGRALLALGEAKEQRMFARRTIAQALSVASLEAKINVYKEGVVDKAEVDEELERMEKQLQRQSKKVSKHLGIENARLRLDAQGRKCINLVFDTEVSFKRFMQKIKQD